jgi:hypothetical protein
MLLTAEDIAGRDIAGPVLVILVLGGGTVYGLGYLMAVMRRNRSDYIKTRDLLPGMRKDYWKSLWSTIKTGGIVFLIFVALLMWWIRGDDRDGEVTPASVPSGTPSRR